MKTQITELKKEELKAIKGGVIVKQYYKNEEGEIMVRWIRR